MQSKHVRALQIGALVCLLGLTYAETFTWMRERWDAPASYYSHGYLIPLVAAFLVWRKREELEDDSSAVQLMAALWRVHFLSGFSLVTVLIGLAFLLYGRRTGKATLFPLLFLLSMVPLPLVLIAGLSLRLKLLAAECAVRLLDVFRVAVVREGSSIYYPGSSLVVDDTCSGLRSLVVLLTLGAMVSYLAPLNRVSKALILLAAVPSAIVANMFRVVCLCVLAKGFGTDVARGWAHDLAGMVTFAIALALLTGVRSTLQRVQPVVAAGPTSSEG